MLLSSWLRNITHGTLFRRLNSRRSGISRHASRRRIEALEDRALLAVQTIIPSMTAISVAPGSPATFDLNYQADGTTGGLTLRMHFDSSELGLTPVQITDVFAASSLGIQIEPDMGNEDGDATTDMVAVASWFDLTQTWPPAATAQPFSLLTSSFSTANLDGSSTVNFTADPGGPGNTVQPIASVVISEAAPVIPNVTIANAAAVTEGAPALFTVTLSASPTSEVTVTYSTADGTATAGADYTARTDETLTFAAGTTQLTQQISIATIDDTELEPGPAETFRVILTNATNANITTAQATGRINDNESPPTISINDVTVDENAGMAVFTISLSAATNQDVTVAYATANGTATAGSDYTATNGTATIVAGMTTATVSVPILDDTIHEDNETFNVNLTNPTNATIADAQGVGTIIDDDAPPLPTLRINNRTVNEGAGSVTFTITLSAASTLPVTVRYTTSDGTAVAGEDYSRRNQIATIPAGERTVTVSIPIIDDTIDEDNETFNVTLTNPTNATIAVALGVATIVDNDLPTLRINNVTVDESAGTAVFTITLSRASMQEVTVAFATEDNTATAGQDYQAASGTATIAAGMTTATVTVTILNDTIHEAATENFRVRLTNPVNATIADDVGVGTIRDDDPPPPVGSIHGRKFNDLDADGTRDAGEPWLNGWTIQLIDDDGNIVAEQVTMDQDLNNNGQIDPETERGWYWFNDVIPGTYTVQEVAQAGWRQTTPATPLQILAFDLDAQFSFVATGNNFEDWGGLQERWFRGSNDWFYVLPTGELFQWDGSPRTALTGTSIAQFDPSFHADTSQLIEPPAVDSARIMVTAGSRTEGVDFGNVNDGLPGSIHGRKFEDANGNGTHDPGEAWLNGWTIQLIDANGNVVDEQVTMDQDLNNNGQIDPATESGWYWFTDVDPGQYTVREVLQDGWEQTAPFDSNALEAFELDQQEQLRHTGNVFENWGGLNERWLLGADGWFYITPNGDVFQWNGSARGNLSGTRVAQLSPEYYQNPLLLAEAVDAAGHQIDLQPGQRLEGINFGNRQVEVSSTIDFPGTGNVDLALLRGDLRLIGDSGHNGIIVYLNADGWVTVEGLGSTTVNHQSTPRVLEGVTQISGDLHIDLRGGNDAVILQGLQIGDDLDVNLDGGNNYLLAEGLHIRDDLIYRSSGGDDIIGIRDSQVSGRVSVRTGGGNDSILVDKLLVVGTSLLSTGTGNDFVFVRDSRFLNSTTAILDGGSDSMAIEGANTFGDSLTVNGGSSTDAIAVAAGSTFARTPNVVSFERNSLPELDSILDDIMQDLADVGLDVALAAF